MAAYEDLAASGLYRKLPRETYEKLVAARQKIIQLKMWIEGVPVMKSLPFFDWVPIFLVPQLDSARNTLLDAEASIATHMNKLREVEL